MPKLYRPHIPLEVRCRVALRQLGELWPDDVIEAARVKPGDAYLKSIRVRTPRKGFGRLLQELLGRLADLLNCKVEELRLDHAPPLALRVQERRGLGRKTHYYPDANSVDHLMYRPHGTQHEGSHDTKTRIRGDRGQFSDLVLIKRQRRRENKKAKKKRVRLRSRSAWPVGRKIHGRSSWR